MGRHNLASGGHRFEENWSHWLKLFRPYRGLRAAARCTLSRNQVLICANAGLRQAQPGINQFVIRAPRPIVHAASNCQNGHVTQT